MNSEQSITVQQATIADVEAVVPLFDAYRQFYDKASNLEGCRAFLIDRFNKNQSVIFLARDIGRTAVGFAQLYPSFSSGALAPVFILNDLFVTPLARRQGVASLLLRAAAAFGREAGAVRLTLSTATTNKNAQSLYESENWNRDEDFHVYHLQLAARPFVRVEGRKL